jgi:hypothetical protein
LLFIYLLKRGENTEGRNPIKNRLTIAVFSLIIIVGVIPSLVHAANVSDLSVNSLFLLVSNNGPVADAGGPYFGNVDESITFNGSGSYDPDGSIISYKWEFGDGTNGSGEITTNTYYAPDSYTVVLTVTDDMGASDQDITIACINDPPCSPWIDGQINGNVGKEYEYIFVSSDVDGNITFYFIDWGDGHTVEWIGPYEAGIPIRQNHSWSESGTYVIKAKAKDIYGAESRWSYFTVNITRKNKATNNILLLSLFEKFPLLQKMFLLYFI